MDFASIVEQLKEERDRLNNAIAALEGVDTRRGRAKGTLGRAPRRLSAKARRRISEAQKKRWARQRKGKKT